MYDAGGVNHATQSNAANARRYYDVAAILTSDEFFTPRPPVVVEPDRVTGSAAASGVW